jgi:pimeloyl-ACP methyl ester carboxylesterase
MGTKDPDFKDPQGEAEWIAEQLHGRVEMIAGAGHYPQAEMPEISGATILSFLQALKTMENAHAA